MRQPLKTLVLVIWGAGSCSEVPMSTDGTCNCPAPTAAQISYANGTSHLASTTVQAAVDELASRPSETPVGPRLQTATGQTTITASGTGVEAVCPDEARDVVLGGACATQDAHAVTIGSTIDNRSASDGGGPKARYQCGFSLNAGQTSSLVQAQAVCLRNAR
jgi:hypothetical protein